MSPYTTLVSNCLFPIHERLKNHDTVALRKELEKTQWYSAGQLQQLQLARLKKFLSEIGEHVAYYREYFRANDFHPGAITSLVDLQKLPLTNKASMRTNMEFLKADNAGKLARFNTGGSSGEPLIFFLGKRVSHDVAAKWRATRWWGVDIGDPEIVVWGSPIEIDSQDRLRKLRDKLLRTTLLSAFGMSKTKLEDFLSTIRKIKPKMLFGYPSALAYLAGYAAEKGISMADLGIQVAFVTSERLYEHQERKIKEVFGCPVANGYGGRDAGFIAHQCPEGRFHITAEDLVVEVVDNEGRVVPVGNHGEIVITHMATADYPFVRYRTGDIGALSDELCPCGRGLPVLREIQGRSTDFIIARDGSVVHGLALIYVLRDLEGVVSFKVTQESLGLTRVEIVKDRAYLPQNEQKIRQVFWKRLGSDVEIRIEYCNEIQLEKSGKHRYVKSKIKPGDKYEENLTEVIRN